MPTSYMITPFVVGEKTLTDVFTDPSSLAFFIGPEAVHVSHKEEAVNYSEDLLNTAGKQAKEFVKKASSRANEMFPEDARRPNDNYRWPHSRDELIDEYLHPFFKSTREVTLRGRRSLPSCELPEAIVEAQAALLVLSMVATEVLVLSHGQQHTAIDGWAERASLDAAREDLHREWPARSAQEAWRDARSTLKGRDPVHPSDWATRLGVDHLIAALEKHRTRRVPGGRAR